MTRNDARQIILKLFRDRPDAYLSGGQLSRELGISRTAVWKHIGALRELGYRIDAVTSRGYRLLDGPELLVPEEIRSRLTTRSLGREILCFDELPSTNSTAMELGDAGKPEGTVVVADRQTAGKGRLGRHWASPGGVNLYLSVLLRPDMPPWEVPRLTFLSAVAAARALRETTGLEIRVKWPNDLLAGGKKIAGLLNEMSAEAEAVHHVVLGIGINVNMTADQFPADLRYPATSVLLEQRRPGARLAILVALLEHLERLYAEFCTAGLEPVRRAWLELFPLLGRQVRVASGATVIDGEVTGLDEEGALLLRRPSGAVERILAGDVLPVD